MTTAHKAHTNGNDFLILEDLGDLNQRFAQKIAHRLYGIGCDQIIYYQLLSDRKAKCFFYNQDGSSAALCLNGVYALAHYLHKNHRADWEISTKHHHFMTHLSHGESEISFDLSILQKKHKINSDLTKIVPELTHAQHIHIGNQHVIVPVDQIEQYPLEKLAKKIEISGLFKDGVNISIFQGSRPKLDMRTHERGAGQTLGCGSAALAVYFGTDESTDPNAPVTLNQPGGQVKLRRENARLFMQAHCKLIAQISFNQ